MISIIFKTHNKSEENEIQIATGGTIMEAAVSNDIEGIEGECGGACACGTCHVHVDESWMKVVGPPEDYERDMLTALESSSSNSRLGCQITVTEDLDGLVLSVPGSDH